MAKQPTLNTILAGYGSSQLLNDNFDAIYDQFANVISRDGSLPNAMLADLDMGGNDIINVGTITYSITNFSFEKDVFVSGTPFADETVYRYVSSFNFQIPVDFAGSYARVQVDPTLTYAYSIRKNGTEIGTVTFSNGSYTGALATTGTSAQRTFEPSDILEIVAPSFDDVTLENTSFTLIGTFSSS